MAAHARTYKRYFFDKYTDKTSVKVTEKTVNYNLG